MHELKFFHYLLIKFFNLISQKIWSICEDIDNISFFTNISNHKVKHAMITYKTHRAAAMARRRLLPERNLLFDGYEIRIEWAHPDISINNVVSFTNYKKIFFQYSYYQVKGRKLHLKT